MIAKIIVHGQNREDALAKLYRALGETIIDGVETIIPYHQALIRSSAFRGGEYTTRFVEENEKLLKEFESHQQSFTAEAALASLLKTHVLRKGQTQAFESGNNQSQSSHSITASSSPDNPWAQAHRLDATRR
jgi:acetyl/propionyl-CoA carboxylase alpha subunit